MEVKISKIGLAQGFSTLTSLDGSIIKIIFKSSHSFGRIFHYYFTLFEQIVTTGERSGGLVPVD